jgi:hypothetical protein
MTKEKKNEKRINIKKEKKLEREQTIKELVSQ